MYCGSLASVHSHKTASPSRVSASCSTSLHMLFFWLTSASTVLRACCQLLTVLQPCCGLRDWGVYVRDSLLCPACRFSRDCCSSRAAQVSMKLRGRVIPEPWPVPPALAGLLDSDLQELLAAEELIDCRRAGERSAVSMGSSDRVSECHEVIRTQFLRDSTHSSGEWRRFSGICRRIRLGDAGRRSRRASRRWTIGRDRRRYREPVGNCIRSYKKIHRILAR